MSHTPIFFLHYCHLLSGKRDFMYKNNIFFAAFACSFIISSAYKFDSCCCNNLNLPFDVSLKLVLMLFGFSLPHEWTFCPNTTIHGDESGGKEPWAPLIIFINITCNSFFSPCELGLFSFCLHSDPKIDFSDMKICNCVLINKNKWLLWTNTSRKISQFDWRDGKHVIIFFSFIVFFCISQLALAHAIFFPLFVCVRARAEMRPVCLLLSQIAPMRDPKITTKGPQWVGWKPCHQPFQHRESPPLLYLWVTPHTSHGDRKGRQSHIFDRNKYFSVLTGLFWPPPPPPFTSPHPLSCSLVERRVEGVPDRGLSSYVVTYPWLQEDQKFGVDEQSWTQCRSSKREVNIWRKQNRLFFSAHKKSNERNNTTHACSQGEPRGN